MSEPYALGIDIGGTKIAYALLHRDGEVFDSSQMPLPKGQSSSEILSDISSRIIEFTSKMQATLAGIGIGCPGQIDTESGLVKNALNLGWHDLNLVEEIQNRLPSKITIRIRKDADANLLGEYRYGAARGFKDVLYICIGSGLGCSILSDGRLVEGTAGTAGGVGHIRLEGNEEICSCGLVGCAETLVSGPGLVNRMKKLFFLPNLDTNPGLLNNLTPAHVLAAAKTGDHIARHALNDLSEALGQIFAVCISMVNPEVIVIGGGLGMAAFNDIIPTAKKEMVQHALPHTYENLLIIPASQQSSAVGAASLVWN
ncbi:MAG: ROK family protein [Anaerolineaceae bacterium]